MTVGKKKKNCSSFLQHEEIAADKLGFSLAAKRS